MSSFVAWGLVLSKTVGLWLWNRKKQVGNRQTNSFIETWLMTALWDRQTSVVFSFENKTWMNASFKAWEVVFFFHLELLGCLDRPTRWFEMLVFWMQDRQKVGFEAIFIKFSTAKLKNICVFYVIACVLCTNVNSFEAFILSNYYWETDKHQRITLKIPHQFRRFWWKKKGGTFSNLFFLKCFFK